MLPLDIVLICMDVGISIGEVLNDCTISDSVFVKIALRYSGEKLTGDFLPKSNLSPGFSQ